MPKNKTAIVTGGTSGIGDAIAKLFAETGTTVVARFLCSDGADMLTGTAIPVDGGRTAN